MIKLIGQMIDKHPELETLVEIAMLSSAKESTPVDPAIIRRQVMAVIEEEDYDDYDYYGHLDLSGLNVFDDLIEDYFAAEEWFNAATVSMVIMETLLDSYEEFHDEEGEVNEHVDGAVAYLERALEKLQDPKQRTAVLKALFDVKAWDIDFGGIDMGYGASETILDAITPQEKELVIDWTRKKLESVPNTHYSGEFARRVYGGFLLDLEKDSLDDETYIRICRESGRTNDLVERLLSLKRVDEALQEVQHVEDYSFLQLADQFVAYGEEEVITPLIQQSAAKEDRPNSHRPYTTWLKDRAVSSGDTATALSILRGMFDSAPSLRHYQELRTIAQEQGEWAQLHTQIIEQLQEADEYSLLTQIHLDEKNIDAALRTVEQIQQSGHHFGLMYTSASDLRLEVAAAAEKSHPNASIRYYLEAAERFIEARGRGNYAQAAQYLQNARRLYQKLDQHDEWLTLIRHIREQNRSLRAMQDEFNRAGLEE